MTTVRPHASASFPVIATAASAGGLSALTTPLSGLPPQRHAALVIVQRLDPRHPSLMHELKTVCQVEPFVRAVLSGGQDHPLLSVETINRRGRTFHWCIRVAALLDPADQIIGAILLVHEEEEKP